MNSYLLDSDILSWYLRGKPGIVEMLNRLGKQYQLGYSTVSLLEVEAGMEPNEEERTITFLDGLGDYTVNKSIAQKAAHYIRESRFKGITLDFADSLVAATASINNLTLVTLNTDHYPMGDVKLHQEAK